MQIGDFVFQEDEAVAEWVSEHSREHPVFEKYTAIGMVRNGVPIAGVVYTDLKQKYGHVQMSIASVSPSWCTRAALRMFFGYRFVQLDCNRVYALCHERNMTARNFLKRLGFVEEAKLRKHFFPRDAYVYGLLRGEAKKWL